MTIRSLNAALFSCTVLMILSPSASGDTITTHYPIRSQSVEYIRISHPNSNLWEIDCRFNDCYAINTLMPATCRNNPPARTGCAAEKSDSLTWYLISYYSNDGNRYVEYTDFVSCPGGGDVGGGDICGLPGTEYCIDNSSPIVVDVTGEGYKLTDLAHGVIFNLTGLGAMKISWTDPSRGNAWLALDRNGNGFIDDGTELFGNFTPQPHIPGVPTNGFLALAVYDLPKNGGNGNGRIDPGDTIYSKLRLWVDGNQNGISEPSELHKLSEFDIAAIDLDYHLSHLEDRFGNRFSYKSYLIEDNERGRGAGRDRRTIWDVFLLHNP